MLVQDVGLDEGRGEEYCNGLLEGGQRAPGWQRRWPHTRIRCVVRSLALFAALIAGDAGRGRGR